MLGEVKPISGQGRGPMGQSPRPKGPRAGVGFLGMGQLAPPHQLESRGERCKLRQRLFNFCSLNLFIYVVLGYHIQW